MATYVAVYGGQGDWVEYDPTGRIGVSQYRMGKRSGTWAFREQRHRGPLQGRPEKR